MGGSVAEASAVMANFTAPCWPDEAAGGSVDDRPPLKGPLTSEAAVDAREEDRWRRVPGDVGCDLVGAK